MSVMKAVKATDRQHVSALSGSSATTESFVRHPSDAGYYYNTMSVSLASKTKKKVENAMSAMPPEIALSRVSVTLGLAVTEILPRFDRGHISYGSRAQQHWYTMLASIWWTWRMIESLHRTADLRRHASCTIDSDVCVFGEFYTHRRSARKTDQKLAEFPMLMSKVRRRSNADLPKSDDLHGVKEDHTRV